ncbi:MAG: DUF3656 domain-containing U32 family peptidase [Ignavibacteriales bacterium]
MKKIELLSPAGNFEALKAAIMNGADAVYLGGKRFGARAFSNNFDDEEMINAVNYAHLYGVKIYVTMNTIIYDDEVDEFVKYVKFLYEHGIDAIIMQDLGMIHLIRAILPNFEIHASTQAHIHNLRGVKYLEEMGVKRVVLARELSLNEIKKIKDNANMEIEIFCHGALCISYSGQCLMSYLIGGRSGNRGECAGTCRLQYELISEENGNKKRINTKGNYLLSTQDLNTLDHIKEFIESGISSLKIEGRMKRPEYVGLITRLYRMAIDAYYNNEEFVVTDEIIIDMKKIFNREFTKGHLFNATNEELMNPLRPNHMGIHLGEIIKVDKKFMTIKLDYSLNQGDGIRIISSKDEGFIVNKLYQNGKLVSNASKNSTIELELKGNVKIGDEVVKTTDIKQLEELSEFDNSRKVDIRGTLYAYKDKLLVLEVNDGIHTVSTSSKVMIEGSKTKPTTKEEMIKQLCKTGNTPYTFDNIDIIGDDNIFIPVSVINELRREVLDKLSDERIKVDRNINIESYNVEVKNSIQDKIKIKARVKNEEQYQACIDFGIDDIYIDDYKQYEKYKENETVHLAYPRVLNNEEILDNSLVGELGSLKKSVITDFSFNTVNAYSVGFLHMMGAQTITLSHEINIDKIKNLIKNYSKLYKINPNLEVIVYGRIEAMVTKYCPLNLYINQDKVCNICKRDNRYYLRDKFSNDYLISSHKCLTTIYNYDKLNMINEINKLINIGIKNIRLNFVDETYDECISILKRISIDNKN